MNTLRSKKEDWSYIEHGSYDVEDIANMINDFDEEWYFDTSRQEMYKTHADTKCITVQSIRLGWVIGTFTISKKLFKIQDQAAKTQIESIVKDLEEKNNGKLVNFEIVSLSGNCRIRTHRDRGDFVYFGRRIHVPVITNPKALFTVAGNEIHMEKGTAYEINNARWHSVTNKSNEDRVHLIFDILPNEYCKTVQFL